MKILLCRTLFTKEPLPHIVHVTHYVLDCSYIVAHSEISTSPIALNPSLLMVSWLIGCSQLSKLERLITHVYFTDHAILAANRCIEEHKLNVYCKLPGIHYLS